MAAAGLPATAVLGVRHHGPGSARAVAAALAALEPDAVLVEGPPEADPILALAADADMVPPVALLAHPADEPGRAAFWPFACFSPEWVALRHALGRGTPVRFIDLPAGHGFALAREREGQGEPGGAPPGDAPPGSPDGPRPPSGAGIPVASDPIAALARAAGHDDPERWWEDVVEHRGPGGRGGVDDPLAPFRAVAEAMAALREPASGGAAPAAGGTRDDALREAYMRQQIRAARRAGHTRIAVVCGAWHVPALERMPTAAHDRGLLRSLPRRVRTEATWVPWTHRRLARHSGYGAGVASPGWYHHLFTAPDRPVARWTTRAAALLREAGHPVSPAHVIEAVRLAETLAALRGRPLAGLTETLDAVRAVLGDGAEAALAPVRERLVVGDAVGRVPDTAPAVPLQRDLTRLQRTLRLRPEAAERHLDLDLRGGTDAARSRLLHRLLLLGVPWGEPAASTVAGTGTFRESWRLRWDPGLAARVVEAAPWGTTVAAAAEARARDTAARASALADLTALAETCLLADLPGALPSVVRAVADRAALDTDTARLAEALPALVRALRYGDVRGTDAGALRGVAEGLAVRICVGLPPACTGLGRDAAEAVRARLDAVHAAVALLDEGGSRGLGDRWAAALRSLAGGQPGERTAGVPGLLRGRAVRLLLDDGALPVEEAARHMALALSTASGPADAADWAEGFLSGGGMLLVHDDRLLGLLDDWLAAVPHDAFTEVLPLLRRTFVGFEAGVRHAVGARVRSARAGAPAGPRFPGGSGSAAPGFAPEPDHARADAVLPVLALLLGLPGPGDPGAPDGPAGPDAPDAPPARAPALGASDARATPRGS
ncbi:DUF5682 family protein [Streptomyces sp. NPDC001380]|uniref:DUF5682 family protein n=1 Tax=Streptomyces sp. NPDC001380 TaxID=3364566 RepID=UPI0036943B5C